MPIYRLPKTVLRVKNNAAQFLNGLTSNSLDRSNNAFLNVHGNIIATFDQIKINDDEFLIVVEDQLVESILSHLDRYLRLSKTTLTKEDYRVYFDTGSDTPLDPGDYTIEQKRRAPYFLVLTKTNPISLFLSGSKTLEVIFFFSSSLHSS